MSADELENRNFFARPVTIALGVVLLVALGASSSRAQDDVAEAARQARERKAAQQSAAHHVYTDEDLKRTKILTSEDTSRAVANRQVRVSPTEPEAQVASTPPTINPEKVQEPETPSLGEVARRYRQEKEAKQAEQAAKTTPPSHYPLDLQQGWFAEPKGMVAPPSGSLREDELRPLRPGSPSVMPGSLGARVAPFAPSHHVVGRSFATAPLASLIASLQRKQVQPGESWWRLAQQYLGNGSRWPELMRVNPGASRAPNRLLAGAVVFVPRGAGPGAGPPGKKIVVRPGDTLWSLAREYLGSGSTWPRLAAANPEVTNFHHLQIGARLAIPEQTQAVRPSTALLSSK